jgi:hypothetical protein
MTKFYPPELAFPLAVPLPTVTAHNLLRTLLQQLLVALQLSL